MSNEMNFGFIVPAAIALCAAVWTLLIAFRWKGDKFLCDTCRFNNDEDCKKVERPQAEICYSYRQNTVRK